MKRSYNSTSITPTKREKKADDLSSEQQKLQLPIHYVGNHIRSTTSSNSTGNREVTIRSKAGGHFGIPGVTVRDISNLLFPKIKVRALGYGNAACCRIKEDNPIGAVAELDGAGHGIDSKIGKQEWFSYCHLPLSNRLGLMTSKGSVRNLEQYADRNNIQVGRKWEPGSALIGDNKGSFRSLFYLGGETKHTFYNISTQDAFVEFYEVRPKRFLLAKETPLETCARDKLINAYDTNLVSNTIGQQNTAVYLRPEDMSWTIGPHDYNLHNKFLVSKPVRQKVVPGETVHYIVKHPAFKYTNSPWWKSVINGSTINALTDLDKEIDYAPFCTVWLLVRLRGSVVYAMPATSNEILADTGGDLDTGVNYGPTQLTHMQAETHYLRSGMYQQEYQEVYFNDQLELRDATTYLVKDGLENETQFGEVAQGIV